MIAVVRCVQKWIVFFKQKTAYEMRISDWSSDVCSSDLPGLLRGQPEIARRQHDRDGEGFEPLSRRFSDRQRRLQRPLPSAGREIGRASCRERGCQYV